MSGIMGQLLQASDPRFAYDITAFGAYQTMIVTALACFPYFGLTVLVCRMFSSVRELPWKKRVDFYSRIVSTTHAIIVTILAYVLLHDEKIGFGGLEGRELAEVAPPAAAHLCAATVGYFVYDLVIMALGDQLSDTPMLIHHSFGIVAFSSGIFCKSCVYFVVLALTFEGSTFFVNLRAHLHSLGWKNSLVYKVNGVLMALSFFFFRIRILHRFPLGVLAAWDGLRLAPLLHQTFIVVIIAVGIALNLYWFYLISSGIVRIVLKRTKVDAEKKRS